MLIVYPCSSIWYELKLIGKCDCWWTLSFWRHMKPSSDADLKHFQFSKLLQTVILWVLYLTRVGFVLFRYFWLQTSIFLLLSVLPVHLTIEGWMIRTCVWFTFLNLSVIKGEANFVESSCLNSKVFCLAWYLKSNACRLKSNSHYKTFNVFLMTMQMIYWIHIMKTIQ